MQFIFVWQVFETVIPFCSVLCIVCVFLLLSLCLFVWVCVGVWDVCVCLWVDVGVCVGCVSACVCLFVWFFLKSTIGIVWNSKLIGQSVILLGGGISGLPTK